MSFFQINLSDLSIVLFCCLLLIPGSSWGSSSGDTLLIDEKLETRLLTDVGTRIYVDTSTNLGISEVQDLNKSQDFTPLLEFEYADKYLRGKYIYWLHIIVKNNNSQTLDVGLDIGVFDSIKTYLVSETNTASSAIYGNRTISNDDGI